VPSETVTGLGGGPGLGRLGRRGPVLRTIGGPVIDYYDLCRCPRLRESTFYRISHELPIILVVNYDAYEGFVHCHVRARLFSTAAVVLLVGVLCSKLGLLRSACQEGDQDIEFCAVLLPS